MSEILALDPGLTKPGVALARDGVIIRADRLKIPGAWKTLEILERCDRVAEAAATWATQVGAVPDLLAVEWPQWYGDKRPRDAKDDRHIDPNDLAGLCGICGSLLGRLRARGLALGSARSPRPKEIWGSVPKTTTGSPWVSPRGYRLTSRLTPAERAAVADYHDAVDAAALAKWAAGLWKPRLNSPGAV